MIPIVGVAHNEASQQADASTEDSTPLCRGHDVLNSRDDQWNAMFLQLLVYRAKHGDCRVPALYPQDKGIGKWVKEQRKRLKEAPLDNERRQKLTRSPEL